MPRNWKKIILILGFLLAWAQVGLATDAAPADTLALIPAYTQWLDTVNDALAGAADRVLPFAAPRSAGLDNQDLEIILSLRRLVMTEDFPQLETLSDALERRQDAFPGQMRFWLAMAQSAQNRNQAALQTLQALVADPRGWENLEPGQRVWVLTSIPDLLFLDGGTETAAVLYGLLAGSPVPQLKYWGEYQLAGLDFLDRDFEQASLRYRTVCGWDKADTWRTQACEMAEITGRLSRLHGEGESHGAVATTGP